MADTIQAYNTSLKRLWNNEVDMENLKIVLLSNVATFNAADDSLDDVAGAVSGGNRPRELYGNGWDQGGETLASVTVTTVDTSKAMVDAQDVNVVATGGPIPASAAAYKAVIIDDASVDKEPLWFITFDSPRQAGSGTNFLVSWANTGIARVGWV